MKRLDKIGGKYGAKIYFCSRTHKFYEYQSSPAFRPEAKDIVGSLTALNSVMLINLQDTSYPLPMRKRPADFIEGGNISSTVTIESKDDLEGSGDKPGP